MTAQRSPTGRFAPKPREELSPSYRRRIERAEAKGKPLKEARGHGIKAIPVWQTQSVSRREAYARSLDVVARMRREGGSLSHASRDVGISPDTVRRYAGSALAKDSRGHYGAKPVDHLYRSMRFYDAKGERLIEPANSKEASKLGEYHNAVKHYLETGDERALRRFRRMRLRTRQKQSLPFVTDPVLLERLAHAGEMSFESIYESVN